MPTENKFLKKFNEGYGYLKNNGIQGVLSGIRYRMSGPGLAYNNWYKNSHEYDEDELERERNHVFEYEPEISIIVPVYLTPEFFLRSMINSVINQTYANWKLILVDGSKSHIDDDDSSSDAIYDAVKSYETERIIHEYMEDESRIEYAMLEKNLGICECLNKAVGMAKGEYILMLSHDDVLTDDALFTYVEALQEQKYDLLYTDEDKMSEDGQHYLEPSFKSDFNIDMLRSTNYIGHTLLVKRDIVGRAGYFRKSFEAVYEYDFVLRCVENSRSVKHISRVTYHWRMNSRAKELSSGRKSLAKESGRSALMEHAERERLMSSVTTTEYSNLYKMYYDTFGNPLISIIVSGSIDLDIIDKTVLSLFEFARYSNFEIIVSTYNNSDKQYQNYFDRLEDTRKNIRVVTSPATASITSLKNAGAAVANGEYLLFIDSNVEIISTNAIGIMLGNCMRDEVAVVGGTIYTDNNSVFSSGIAVGINGLFTHFYRGLRKGDLGYLLHNICTRDVSAVSSSAMMIRKSVFEKVGGFSTRFPATLADIDLCLKIREEDRLIVVEPDAMWQIHGPIREIVRSRDSYEDTEAFFRIIWSNILRDGDPFYNNNFAKDRDLFNL